MEQQLSKIEPTASERRLTFNDYYTKYTNCRSGEAACKAFALHIREGFQTPDQFRIAEKAKNAAVSTFKNPSIIDLSQFRANY